MNPDKNVASDIQPLVTIGITCYNAEATISRALKSAINQDWTNREIILVDDCSTDKSLRVINDLIERLTNIKIIRNYKNSGVAFSRNIIINESQGEYIVFFDDDDVSTEDRITKQYNDLVILENLYGNDCLAISHCTRNVIYTRDGTNYIQLPIGTDSPCGGAVVAQHFLVGFGLENGGSISTCAQMGSVKTYRALNGFDTHFRRCEDSDFVIRAALKGAFFIGTKNALVEQYMIKKDKSLDQEIYYHRQLLDKHKEYLMAKGYWNFAKRWSEFKYSIFRKRFIVTRLVFVFVAHPILCIRRIFSKRINFKANNLFFKWHTKA